MTDMKTSVAHLGGSMPYLLVLACLAGGDTADSSPKDLILRDGFPAINDAQRKLDRVPFAPGAPASVLLEVRQNEWIELGPTYYLRLRHFRRTKILTEAGAADHGDYSLNLYGDWRVKEVEARTVLPGGSIVEAAGGVFHEKSDAGFQVVTVAFPRVSKGAILDFHITVASDSWGVPPWQIQERLPVLESRFLLFPPEELKYRVARQRFPEDLRAEKVRLGNRDGFVWRLADIEPLSDAPNLPPMDDISKALYIIPEEYHDGGYVTPIARDWQSWGKHEDRFWDDWMKGGQGDAQALAKQVAGEAASPIAKAEAVRRALRDRVRVEYLSSDPQQTSPDSVLAKGVGSSADLAGTAVAMLRAVGVDAALAAIRRRSAGTIPAEFPVPVLFNDYLVRLPAGSEPAYFSPSADSPASILPWDCTGILA